MLLQSGFLSFSFFSFFLIFLNYIIIPVSAACATLSANSMCNGILEYKSVYIANNSCSDDREYIINGIGVPIWGLLSPSCQNSIAYMMCRTVYPECHNGTVTQLCQSSCLNLTSDTNSCTPEDFQNLNLVNNSWFNFSCENNPISNCTEFNGTFPYPNIPTQPTCQTLPDDSPCKPYVGDSVFIPGYPSASTYIGLVNLFVHTYDKVLPLIGDVCSIALTRAYCGNVFSNCTSDLFSTTLKRPFTYQPVFPAPPCTQVCQDYLTQCKPFLRNPNGTDWISKNGLDNFCGRRDVSVNILQLPKNYCNKTMRNYSLDYSYPIYTYINLSPLELDDGSNTTSSTFGSQCNTMGIQVNVNLQCFLPTVKPDDNNTIGYLRSLAPGVNCELPCPATYVWNDDEWHSSASLMYVSIPSFVLSTFMLLTYTIFDHKRKQQYILSFIICIWLVGLVLVFSFSVVKQKKPEMQSLQYISCKNNAEGASMLNGGYCVFQAIMLFEFLLCATCWWFIIALEVFYKVVLEKRFTPDQERKQRKFCHLFAWGYPTLSLAIFLAAGGKLGGSVTSIFMFCFIYHDAPLNNPWQVNPKDNYLDYLFWYGPIGLMGIAGACLMIAVLYKVFKTTQRSKQIFRQDGVFWIHLRPLCFVLSFLLVFFWFFVWRVQYSMQETTFLEKMFVFLQCQTTQPDLRKCESKPRPTNALSTWAWYALHFFLSFQGILVFLTWGTQSDTFTLWSDSILVLLGIKKKSSSQRSTYQSGIELSSKHQHNRNITQTKTTPQQPSPLACQTDARERGDSELPVLATPNTINTPAESKEEDMPLKFTFNSLAVDYDMHTGDTSPRNDVLNSSIDITNPLDNSLTGPSRHPTSSTNTTPMRPTRNLPLSTSVSFLSPPSPGSPVHGIPEHTVEETGETGESTPKNEGGAGGEVSIPGSRSHEVTPDITPQITPMITPEATPDASPMP